MSAFTWLYDAANLTLWIVVIHPLLVFLLTRAVWVKSFYVVENLPPAPDKCAKTKEKECSTRSKTLADDDSISPISAADVNGETQPSWQTTTPREARIEELKARKARVAARRAKSLKSRKIKLQSNAFVLNNWEILKCVPIYILQILLTQRLGVLVMRKINATNRLTDMFLGSLAMSLTTFMILVSGLTLSYASRMALRGYRPAEGEVDLETRPVLASFLFTCFYSLAIPWLRLLFAFCQYFWEW